MRASFGIFQYFFGREDFAGKSLIQGGVYKVRSCQGPFCRIFSEIFHHYIGDLPLRYACWQAKRLGTEKAGVFLDQAVSYPRHIAEAKAVCWGGFAKVVQVISVLELKVVVLRPHGSTHQRQYDCESLHSARMPCRALFAQGELV